MGRTVREARPVDITSIMHVMEAAKKIMRSSGNMHQWEDGYPSEAVIFSDMEKHGGFVIEDTGRIVGYFAFLPSPEPTYSMIYNGEWLDDIQSYHVIHRIASNPDVHGIFSDILDFCFSQDANIRIDTHKDNRIMQHNIVKHGFTYCGIIYLANGDERLAYQKLNDEPIFHQENRWNSESHRADLLSTTKETISYKDIPIAQFVDIILKGDDEAMYYLLHKRMKHLLYERYQDYSHNLYDDFDDVLEDFFFYVRESSPTPYLALQRIKKTEAFDNWLLNTFRNYLNNRSEKESRINFVDKECEQIPLLTEDSTSNGEIKIRIVSQLIAYALQVFYPRGRFIFLRSLLTILNEQQAMPDKEMAEALDMSYISYRVTLHHMRNNVRCFREKLLRGESLRLDDKQKDLAKHIYDDFPNLYPILFDCYIQCIDTLKTSAAVKELRSQYMEERGFVVHEPSISEQTHITITRFWEKLNQWLRVDKNNPYRLSVN